MLLNKFEKDFNGYRTTLQEKLAEVDGKIKELEASLVDVNNLISNLDLNISRFELKTEILAKSLRKEKKMRSIKSNVNEQFEIEGLLKDFEANTNKKQQTLEQLNVLRRRRGVWKKQLGASDEQMANYYHDSITKGVKYYGKKPKGRCAADRESMAVR